MPLNIDINHCASWEPSAAVWLLSEGNKVDMYSNSAHTRFGFDPNDKDDEMSALYWVYPHLPKPSLEPDKLLPSYNSDDPESGRFL
jgi:hypothetical protein